MKIIINNGGAFYTGHGGCLARLTVLTLAVVIGALLLPGVTIDSGWAVLLTALVISLLDNLIRPILIVITLPVTIVTLGLFLFIINAIIILMASAIVGGFHVNSLGTALLYSLILMVVNYLLELPNRYLNRPPLRHKDDNDDNYTPYEEIKD